MQFMMKLTDHIATIRGNVLMVPTLPKVSEAYMLFAQEERHQEVSKTVYPTESLAFVAEKRRFGGDNWNNKSFKSQATGSQQFQKSGSSNRSNSQYFYTHCQIPGHSLEICFKINGYPPGFKHFKSNKTTAMSTAGDVDADTSNNPRTEANTTISVEQYNQLMSLLRKQQQNYGPNQPNLALMAGNICLISHSNSKWLLDSGASYHFCHDLSQFSGYKRVENQSTYITIPDGSKIHVKHKGKLIPLGDVSSGLYNVGEQNIATTSTMQPHVCNTTCSTAVNNSKLWHLRLGHLSVVKSNSLGEMGKSSQVFRLVDLEKNWQETDYLGNQILFISKACSVVVNVVALVANTDKYLIFADCREKEKQLKLQSYLAKLSFYSFYC
ncbi:uncharacterized protein [Spinacia oleracea]|uniref:Retrovirus-related Pol polyprotein from transposon TNT 1-94-like beta-barrel domain-containing protein n=1 Tax=Spinacia oleracea TaxID=3562 RepID=A0A9R0HU29_SPIOL|nr:uncharacterized protein LOC110776801 [Spinacia oleracea]